VTGKKKEVDNKKKPNGVMFTQVLTRLLIPSLAGLARDSAQERVPFQGGESQGDEHTRLLWLF
jgi:hypothetical protein